MGFFDWIGKNKENHPNKKKMQIELADIDNIKQLNRTLQDKLPENLEKKDYKDLKIKTKNKGIYDKDKLADTINRIANEYFYNGREEERLSGTSDDKMYKMIQLTMFTTIVTALMLGGRLAGYW